jgi:hypothetical protein
MVRPLVADHLIFEWGGGGLEDFEKIFPAIQGERKKNHAAYNREKKYHAKESAQKTIPIPTCKSPDVVHFSIVSTGLQDFAFLSRQNTG